MSNSFFMEFDPRTRKFSRRLFMTPQLIAGEVLVNVVRCTLCGSDLHTFNGRRSAPERCVLGHETIGTIAGWFDSDIPRDYHGRTLDMGDRVTWTMAVGCGACFWR